MAGKYGQLKLVKVEPIGDFVYKVSLNRPSKYNALDMEIWKEIGDCFQLIDEDPDCRVVVLQGEGKHFCTGLDLNGVGLLTGGEHGAEEDQARKSRIFLRKIKFMQKQFTYIDECSKPVLLAIHGYCLGAAIDIATACDVRFATKDAEISLSARHFSAAEALQFGLLSRVFETREEMLTEVQKGTKHILNYARDHPVENSLNYVAAWNMSQLFTEDLMKAGLATFAKEPQPPFAKL
ncbi:unnamed protein product [Caenorhabditis sp. 36 PRJEB53466]|nr:unnamed protein product [Caenorhabditis sp. 36 PRJEB53466]